MPISGSNIHITYYGRDVWCLSSVTYACVFFSGKRLGVLKTKIALCQLLRNYKFAACSETPARISYSSNFFVQVPAGGICLKVERRNARWVCSAIRMKFVGNSGGFQRRRTDELYDDGETLVYIYLGSLSILRKFQCNITQFFVDIFQNWQ